MKKYIVECVEKNRADEPFYSTILGIYDTQDEAEDHFYDACAECEYENDYDNAEVTLGIVREEDLLTPEDWESYKKIEIIAGSAE